MTFVLIFAGIGLILLWISALIRFFVLLVSERGWKAFSYRPVLNWFWLGSAVISFFAVLLFPVGVHGPQIDWNTGASRADLQNLENACRAYSMEYGSYPSGTQVQVLQILRGGNARGIVFFETPSRRNAINKQGELVDTWGTPYKFSIVESNLPVILSAGANRLFGDQDDLSTTN